MNNGKKINNSILKATIKNIIVAFLYGTIILILTILPNHEKIDSAISIINRISINTSKQILSDVKIDLEHNRLEHYPEFGSRFANIKIEDLNIDLPLYYGDTLSILRNGVGMSSGAYFPGEKGSIICMGHNTAGYLRKLPEIKKGSKIKIDAVYGEYTYTVYDTKIVDQTNLEAVPVQKEKEILMLYTCYPINSIGHAKSRFIVYASLD